MTFEEFKATARHVDDLEKELAFTIYGDPTIKCPGIIYADVFYIEKACRNWTHEAREEGDYFLIIGRLEWLSFDLEPLERQLYDYAKQEGYFQ